MGNTAAAQSCHYLRPTRWNSLLKPTLNPKSFRVFILFLACLFHIWSKRSLSGLRGLFSSLPKAFLVFSLLPSLPKHTHTHTPFKFDKVKPSRHGREKRDSQARSKPDACNQMFKGQWSHSWDVFLLFHSWSAIGQCSTPGRGLGGKPPEQPPPTAGAKPGQESRKIEGKGHAGS